MLSAGATQRYKITLNSRWATGANNPTAPTGTTSLLEKAFNAPGTALAIVATSRATNGISYSGNFVIESARVAINQADAIMTQYRFRSSGAVTATATT
jgi:hypothetical protein